MKLKSIVVSFVALMSIVGLISPVAYAAESANVACEAIAEINPAGDCDKKAADKGINKTVSTILNIISFIAAFIAVITLIVGGLRYVTSQGDANAVKKAKDNILYAIIGVVIVAFSQILVKFVLSRSG